MTSNSLSRSKSSKWRVNVDPRGSYKPPLTILYPVKARGWENVWKTWEGISSPRVAFFQTKKASANWHHGFDTNKAGARLYCWRMYLKNGCRAASSPTKNRLSLGHTLLSRKTSSLIRGAILLPKGIHLTLIYTCWTLWSPHLML